MTHGSLFSGIGGFDLAAEWMGWENVFHCEWNEFGKKILKYYWPNAISYHDITKTDFTIHRGTIDILTGGFPCQPYSAAGKRLGTEDNRHLWPEMLRAIREIQPRYVVGENVRGLTNWNGGLVFDQVQADLENEGYEITPFLLPACAVNAPHRRDRIWFIANRNNRREGRARVGRERDECKFKGSEIRGEFITGGKSGTSPLASSQRCNNGSDNREERHLSENKGTTQESESEREGWEFGTRQVGSISTNPTNIGHEQPGGSWKWRPGLKDGDRYESSPHTNSRRQSGKEHGQAESGWLTETGIRNDWRNFPTQSPICSRNDGISTRLDGITFPKWRNESIKGFGNAVVPELVYQIFKAIEQYELK